MKSNLLICFVLLSQLYLSAQRTIPEKPSSLANLMLLESLPQPISVNIGASLELTFVDTFYLNDFSDSTDFTEINTLGEGPQWKFGTNASIGNGFFSNNTPFASTSAANGYAMFDIFPFNQNPYPQVNSYITVGPIDLSSAESPLSVNFEQFYARFQDSADVFYSFNGSNFTLLGGNSDMPTFGQNSQGQTIGAPTENGELKSIIANQLAGQPQVWLRFRFKSSTVGYSWLIDDLTITEFTVPQTDIALSELYTLDNRGLDYRIIPQSQADTLLYCVIVANNGSIADTTVINYNILRNGSSVSVGTDTIYNDNTYGGIDTLYFYSNYILADTGTYTMNVTLVTSGDDFTPDNNTLSSSFVVSDFVYSQLPNLIGVESLSFSGGQAPYNSYKVGDTFYARANESVYAVNVALPRPTTAVGTLDLLVEIYDATSPTTLANPINVADLSLDLNHPATPSYKTVLFDPPVEFQAGKFYQVTVSSFDIEKPFSFYGLLASDFDKSTRIYGPFGINNAVNWYRVDDFIPAIQVITNPLIARVEADEQELDLSIYPNPANRNINLSLKSFDNKDVILRLTDIHGRIVFNRLLENSGSIFESIPVEAVANGIYTLQVLTEKENIARKIVIAH
jgi:hypothetical protein